MAKTLSQLKTRVLALLDDVSGTSYSEALVLEACQSAIRQIIEYYPLLAEEDITTFTGTGPYVGTLPTGILTVDAVLDIESNKVLPKVALGAGDYTGENMETNSWHLYTSGSLTLAKDPTDGVRVYYRGLYNEPAEDEDVLTTPDILFNMLGYFACSEAVVAKAVTAGNIGQYDVTVDSGNPEHNPMLVLQRYFLGLYHNAAKLLPDLERPTPIG